METLRRFRLTPHWTILQQVEAKDDNGKWIPIGVYTMPYSLQDAGDFTIAILNDGIVGANAVCEAGKELKVSSMADPVRDTAVRKIGARSGLSEGKVLNVTAVSGAATHFNITGSGQLKVLAGMPASDDKTRFSDKGDSGSLIYQPHKSDPGLVTAVGILATDALADGTRVDTGAFPVQLILNKIKTEWGLTVAPVLA